MNIPEPLVWATLIYVAFSLAGLIILFISWREEALDARNLRDQRERTRRFQHLIHYRGEDPP